MRALGTFGVVLAAGLALASCTKQGAGVDANGRIARQSAGAAGQVGTPAAPSASAVKHARFAALPDRGELLRYDAQAPILDGAYTWHRTELSEQHALDAIANGLLRIATPDGRLLGFQYDRSIRHEDSGDWTWIGHLQGQEGVQAILTFGAGAVYGSIGQPGSRPLRLTMRDGASWLVETDPAQFAGMASHAANPVSPDYQIVSPAALKRLLAQKPASGGVDSAGLAPKATSAAVAAVTTVDLVIGYTQGFVTAQGGTSNVVTRLNSLVDTANTGLLNSKVSGQIRLVHTMQVNYTDTNTNDDALDQLTGYDPDSQDQTTPNAAFNALRAARETYGADLVSLVRPFKDPEQDSCGIAWLIGGGKQKVTSTNGWDYFGYSVVSDGQDKNEQDGKTYYCEEHTLAHELGHNMGSAHDRETAKGDDGTLDDPDDYGAFPYSFGYKPAAFYTIMAYGDSGQTSYLTFSNPRTTFCGGAACGVNNSEDNAKSLGSIMPPVSGFRATVASDGDSLPAARHIDANGNGFSDLFFFNHSTGSLVTWYMNATTRTAYSNSAVPGAYQVVGTGNFSSDNRNDLFMSGTGGKLYLGISNGSTFVVQTLPYTLDASQAIASGDFNGNGKTDLLLLNSSTGQIITWFMNNSTRTSYTSQSLPAGLRFVAVGDFNGDKMDDLLFEGAQGSIYIAISYGTIFQMRSTGLSHSSSYSIRGLADVNGDGRADILLHSASLNKLVVWYMDGTTRTTYNSITSPAGAALVASGDFDHNGKEDLGWVHPTSGEIWLSLSAGYSFTTSLLSYTYNPSASKAMDIDP
ncbi:MAG: M12 family metallo-peptidase [Thermomonas sp.]